MSAAETVPVARKDRVLVRFEPTGENGAGVKEARVAALSISGPTIRLTRRRIEPLARSLQEQARALHPTRPRLQQEVAQ